jgi:hypothetical protein
MTLTLQLDEEEQDIFVAAVQSNMLSHELVYYINTVSSLNFCKEPNPYNIFRKGSHLNFEWYTHQGNEDTTDHIVSNSYYQEQTATESVSLFDSFSEIKHFLIPSLKSTSHFILSAQPYTLPAFNPRNHTRITNFEHIDSLSKRNQKHLLNIFYEKQS